jgi:ABC-type nitrate/sulfonate/bicarbonate transport system substrate-binding protein
LSVEAKPIRTPADLAGKKVGVQPANEQLWNTLLRINNVDAAGIKKVPVQSDPTPLAKGELDGWFASLINEPVTVQQLGAKPS